MSYVFKGEIKISPNVEDEALKKLLDNDLIVLRVDGDNDFISFKNSDNDSLKSHAGFLYSTLDELSEHGHTFSGEIIYEYESKYEPDDWGIFIAIKKGVEFYRKTLNRPD